MEKFSFDTIQDFDSHIKLSIPDYDHLQVHIKNMVCNSLNDDDLIYDLGCSTGRLIGEMAEMTDIGNFIGIDKSDNLLGKHAFMDDRVTLQYGDLLETKLKPCDIVLSIFTLQFLKPHNRCIVLENIAQALRADGYFIMAEKVVMPDALIETVFSSTYTQFKLGSFTQEQIKQKKEDLKTIMSPQSEENIKKELTAVGFSTIIPFWQSLNFKAWLITK